MKVLLINTADTGGGAAIACKRLMEAHASNGLEVKMLVMNKKSTLDNVHAYSNKGLAKKLNFLRFVYERLCFLPHEKDKSIRFSFSLANTGIDISNHPLVKEADVIHIHWVNGGFLSLKDIEKLLDSNKKIVWTLHDMWLFTGGCHYASACENYKTSCHQCPFLKNPSSNDLSSKIWKRKALIFENRNLSIVACSKWLANEASLSSLLRKSTITAIPNPISLTQFAPKVQAVIRERLNIPLDKFVLLFGAANIQDKRKGFIYLIQALEELNLMGIDKEQVCLVVFGKAKGFDSLALPFPVINLGSISSAEQMADIYAMADLFVLPSLEDNLPNTVMESMACGTPVVGFNIGGVPEMVQDGVSGGISETISGAGLAKVMKELIQSPTLEGYRQNARKGVEEKYNNELISKKYCEVYLK